MANTEDKEKNIVLDNQRRLLYLFPNKKLFDQINFETAKFSKRFAKLLGIITTLAIFLGITIISIEFEHNHLFFCLVIYLFGVFIGVFTVLAYRPQKNTYKQQYLELLKDKDKYKNQIILHNNYKKFKRKWNIFYLIALLISTGLSLNQFITDLAKDGQANIGAIFILALGLIILTVPLFILNMVFFKKFRTKQKQIEELIDINIDNAHN